MNIEKIRTLENLLDEYGWSGAAKQHPEYGNLPNFWNNQTDAAIMEWVKEIFGVAYRGDDAYGMNLFMQEIEMDLIYRQDGGDPRLYTQTLDYEDRNEMFAKIREEKAIVKLKQERVEYQKVVDANKNTIGNVLNSLKK